MIATMGKVVSNKSLGIQRAPSSFALFIKDVSMKGVTLPIHRRLVRKTFVATVQNIIAKWSRPQCGKNG